MGVDNNDTKTKQKKTPQKYKKSDMSEFF